MSSEYTLSSVEDGYSLERPLVVKCTFDQKKKRITFGSAKNCSYHVLREKVDKCFSLSGTDYKIIWDDDDGEHCMIESDVDVEEAVKFFASEEPPSSNASILSGHSSSGRRITMQVTIHIDYDGPSLSETSSIASREENGLCDFESSLDLSSYSRTELEDDEITVSSKNAYSSTAARRPLNMSMLDTIHSTPYPSNESDFLSVDTTDPTEIDDDLTKSQYLSGPFEMLKINDPSVDADPGGTLLHTERGAAWLRDQSTRTIKSRLGALPEPSDKSVAVNNSQIDDGELSLHRDPSGKFYYSYTSGTSSSFDSGYDESPSVAEGSVAPPNYRPTSMELSWFESLEQSSSTRSRPVPRNHDGAYSDSNPFRNLAYTDIPLEVLPFITPPAIPQPDELTTCSKCDIILDSIRYVCSTCKERKPRSRDEIEASRIEGKGKAPRTGGFLCASPRHAQNGRFTNGFSIPEKQISLLPDGTPDPGYELCPNCLESAGVDHALEMSLAPGSSPSPTSPENTLSQWRRTAPQNKGQLRHSYLEKVWVAQGWQDVQQDELNDPQCSTCNSNIVGKRYKCASCNRFNLCRACYSQVHDIHPSHAFLVVLDKPINNRSDPSLPIAFFPPDNDLRSMQHPGVTCAHCLRDIVGARFHCAVCESVDICQNCESAGLPGNLDSPEGGHDSSHIMIKIPYPLESSKVQAASNQAIVRWNGGDADNVRHAGSQLRSRRSSWDGTVRMDSIDPEVHHDHKIQCSSCSQPIMGIRYQCANCPSLPRAYNLCSVCEERSYVVHNQLHVFFKFPRPVHRPLESVNPQLSRLYKYPAGPSHDELFDPHNPKEYLRHLEHSSAYCDRCMTRIRGEWFRCVYCDKDLCDACEALDTHGDTHFFVVFKAQVDMDKFSEQFGDSGSQSQPVVSYAVYLR